MKPNLTENSRINTIIQTITFLSLLEIWHNSVEFAMTLGKKTDWLNSSNMLVYKMIQTERTYSCNRNNNDYSHMFIYQISLQRAKHRCDGYFMYDSIIGQAVDLFCRNFFLFRLIWQFNAKRPQSTWIQPLLFSAFCIVAIEVLVEIPKQLCWVEGIKKKKKPYAWPKKHTPNRDIWERQWFGFSSFIARYFEIYVEARNK